MGAWQKQTESSQKGKTKVSIKLLKRGCIQKAQLNVIKHQEG